MKQLTLATVAFERYAKRTRSVLAEMMHVVPSAALCALIERFYIRAVHQTRKGVQWYFDGLSVHPLCAKSESKILDIGWEDAAHGASSPRKRIQQRRF
jgi:hypothetical protein